MSSKPKPVLQRDPSGLAAELEQVRSRFDAIVSNTPGLVYQFVLHADGRVSFPYLSDGCQALLGLTAADLAAEPARFLNLILADDRKAYLDSMQASAAALWSWNWEGRIWVDAWKDVKWINLRSTPHTLPGGAVQWEGIMTNITESKLEQLEVRHSRARLAELTAHIEKVKEQERTRIAREIHDELGGNLTAIKMALAMLAARLPADQASQHRTTRPATSTRWSTAPSTRCTASRSTCARPCWTWASSPRWNGRARNLKSRPASAAPSAPTRRRSSWAWTTRRRCSAFSRRR